MVSKTLNRIGLTVLLVVVLITVYIGLIFYQENLESQCYNEAWPLRDSYLEKYPDGLITISLQEKKELGIDQDIQPYWQYYEAKKCLKEKSWLL